MLAIVLLASQSDGIEQLCDAPAVLWVGCSKRDLVAVESSKCGSVTHQQWAHCENTSVTSVR